MSRKGKILIVEDEETNLCLFESIMQIGNFDYTATSNAYTLFNLVQSYQPDVILMDIALKAEISPIDLIQKIRAEQTLASTSIFAVTASKTDQITIGIEETCSDRIITKPFDIDYLLSCLKTAVREGREGLMS